MTFIHDFLFFRRMLTPMLIQILFWVGLLACLVIGIIDLAHRNWAHGLQMIFLGPIAVRISSEFLILFFRMNETLTSIEHQLHKSN